MFTIIYRGLENLFLFKNATNTRAYPEIHIGDHVIMYINIILFDASTIKSSKIKIARQLIKNAVYINAIWVNRIN